MHDQSDQTLETDSTTPANITRLVSVHCQEIKYWSGVCIDKTRISILVTLLFITSHGRVIIDISVKRCTCTRHCNNCNLYALLCDIIAKR